MIPSSANNLFHVECQVKNRRVLAHCNYEYKSANDGGGGSDGGQDNYVGGKEEGLGGK